MGRMRFKSLWVFKLLCNYGPAKNMDFSQKYTEIRNVYDWGDGKNSEHPNGITCSQCRDFRGWIPNVQYGCQEDGLCQTSLKKSA